MQMAPDPAGHAGAHATGPDIPCRPRRVAHGRERPGGPGGGSGVHPSPGVMPAGGGHAQLFPVLRGLCLFYLNCGQRQLAQELAEQLLRQAERQPEVAPRMLGHYLLGLVLFRSWSPGGCGAALCAGHYRL